MVAATEAVVAVVAAAACDEFGEAGEPVLPLAVVALVGAPRTNSGVDVFFALEVGTSGLNLPCAPVGTTPTTAPPIALSSACWQIKRDFSSADNCNLI